MCDAWRREDIPVRARLPVGMCCTMSSWQASARAHCAVAKRPRRSAGTKSVGARRNRLRGLGNAGKPLCTGANVILNERSTSKGGCARGPATWRETGRKRTTGGDEILGPARERRGARERLVRCDSVPHGEAQGKRISGAASHPKREWGGGT